MTCVADAALRGLRGLRARAATEWRENAPTTPARGRDGDCD